MHGIGSGSANGGPAAVSTSGGGSFDDLFGPPAPAATAAPAFPSITAWEKDGIRIAFDFSKPPGQPAVTDITGTYTTASTAISDFTLQARALGSALSWHVQSRQDLSSLHVLQAPFTHKHVVHNIRYAGTAEGFASLCQRLSVSWSCRSYQPQRCHAAYGRKHTCQVVVQQSGWSVMFALSACTLREKSRAPQPDCWTELHTGFTCV